MAAARPRLLTLDSSIELVAGVGPKLAGILRNHDILTVRDFLAFYPRAWIDATTPTPIAALSLGSPAAFRGRISHIMDGRSQRGLRYIKAQLTDESGSIEIMWFNMPYLKRSLKSDVTYNFYGAVRQWRGGQKIIIAPRQLHALEIIPIYRAIGGVPSYQLQKLVKPLLPFAETVPDYLPADIGLANSLIGLSKAITWIHAPEVMTQVIAAKRRLAADELVMLSAPALMAKRAREALTRQSYSIHRDDLAVWLERLPFELTHDQHQAIDDILADLAQPRPMNRLVQGDVGSGKTVVGLAAALEAKANREQTVWLAPTEVLARQHYMTACSLLAGTGMSVALWTRASKHLSTGNQKAATDQLVSADLVIGTHAVLSADHHVPKLGLLIIDEQHRFGVKQRSWLRKSAAAPPHLLSLTATPIPRTLSLMVYGDLAVSRIASKPVARKPVTSRVVTMANRDKAYGFVEGRIAAGDQVFVVCPQIDTSDRDDSPTMFGTTRDVSVAAVFDDLSRRFPARRLGLLHGKLKSKDKQAVMDAFRNHDLDILVSTTVIEVGVDVPNATTMMVMGAERFGLVQLHQLRGRIGRGDKPSYCLLFPSTDAAADSQRLHLIETVADGFALAEEDLKLRGPGEIIGEAQSGIPRLRFADPSDTEQVKIARTISVSLVDDPLFTDEVVRFWQAKHPE